MGPTHLYLFIVPRRYEKQLRTTTAHMKMDMYFDSVL
jgi:hypothetical protein